MSGVTISPSSPSIKSGATASITCKIEASDFGTGIQWFKDSGLGPIESDDFKYNIDTILASSAQKDGITMVFTSTLQIYGFTSDDVDSYSCRVNYDDPVLDESSAQQSLSIRMYQNY